MPDMSGQEFSQAQMGRMKELNEVNFKRVGKSGLFENHGAIIDVKENGSLGLMVDYDPRTDWPEIKGFQIGGGMFNSFHIVTLEADGTVMERTLNGSGGGFGGKVRPTLEKFRGKTMEQQLLDAGFVPDKTDPQVLRYQLSKKDGNGEILAWTVNGQVQRMVKPIDNFLKGMLDNETQIIACTEEPDRFSGTNTILTIRNSIMEFKINTKFGGKPIEGSQKLLRSVSPKELGMKPFEVITEPSGFKIGGRNETKLISGLTEIAGQPITKLEDIMRPDHASMAGFLGEDESLLKVMAEDNDFVLSQGITHQDLAAVLMYARAHYFKGYGKEFSLGGRKYKMSVTSYMGSQDSPFQDGTGAHSDMTITNLDTDASLSCSCLLADMIERYGFYEGKQTSYRLEPAAVLEVFDFLAKSSVLPHSQTFL